MHSNHLSNRFVRNTIFISLIGFCSLMTSYSQELVPQLILDNTMSLSVPKGFSLLSNDIIAKKYPSGNRPSIVYGNPDATINLVVNYTEDGITKEELSDALEVFSKQFERAYPGIEWYTKELQLVNAKKFVVLEFHTPAVDTEIYNLMFMTEHQERLLIFSFNCTLREKSQWEKVGKEILKSIKVL